jgi:Protein of unknown function (DUF1403)
VSSVMGCFFFAEGWSRLRLAPSPIIEHYQTLLSKDKCGACNRIPSPKAPPRATLGHGSHPAKGRRRDTSTSTANAGLGPHRCARHRQRRGSAFRAGAALAVLDGWVRADVRGVPFAAGAWRRRLALKAAAASARITRRGEDEATLRDAFLLRHGGARAGGPHAGGLARARSLRTARRGRRAPGGLPPGRWRRRVSILLLLEKLVLTAVAYFQPITRAGLADILCRNLSVLCPIWSRGAGGLVSV